MHQQEKFSLRKMIPILLCNVFEYYDIAVYTVLAPIIAVIFFPSDSFLTSSLMTWGVFALRFISRPIGGFLFGYLADKAGRKKTLYITCASMGLATLCISILPSHQHIGIWAPVLFVFFQMVQSASYAGEVSTLIVYIMEVTEKKYHVKVGMFISLSSMLGFLIAACLVIVLRHGLDHAQMISWGWRIPFFLGMINISIAFLYRLKLQETPFFMQLSHSHKDTDLSFNWLVVLQNILILAPVSFLFYFYSTSGSRLIGQMYQTLTPYFPLFNIVILMGFVWFTGSILARYMSGKQLMLLGSVLLMVLAIPVNIWLGQTQTLTQLLCAKCLMAGILALLITPFKQVIFGLLKNVRCRTLTLGISVNVAMTLFGGTAPLIAVWLSQYGTLAIGCYSAVIGMLSVMGLVMAQRGEKQAIVGDSVF